MELKGTLDIFLINKNVIGYQWLPGGFLEKTDWLVWFESAGQLKHAKMFVNKLF